MIKLYQVQRNLNTWEFDNKFSDLQPIIKSSNWESHLTSQRRYKEDTKSWSLSLRVTITWCWGVIFPGAWTFSLWLETKTTRKFTCHRFASLYSVQVQEVVRGTGRRISTWYYWAPPVTRHHWHGPDKPVVTLLYTNYTPQPCTHHCTLCTHCTTRTIQIF